MSVQMSKTMRRLVEFLFWAAMTGLFFFILMQLSEYLPENF